MSLPVHVVRDQSHIPWHLRKYEIYQPPAFGARAPPKYLNHHLLSASARERLQRELAASYAAGRVPLPALTSNGSVFSGVGSGMGGSVRSSLSVRRPSFLGTMSANLGGSAGMGLETITASPASTAAPLNSPSLDPTSALNNGPAASHRLSTWLKRPPASPHTSTQPLPTDATDLMDGTDPFGSMWHHSSPYDAGEMVGRGFGRSRDSAAPENVTPHTRPGILSPPTAPAARKGPSPLSQSTSAINLTDSEPPLPEPPGSPDLLSGTRRARKLSKRRSTSASRGGLTSLFTRKASIEDDGQVDGRGGLRGRSRPPLSPSSLSLAQNQGIAFPSGPHDGAQREKRPRRRLSKRGRSGSTSSAVSVDSAAEKTIETPIHTQFARDLPELTRAGREVEIVELPSAKFPARAPSTGKPLPQPQARPPSHQPRPPSHQHTQSAPEHPASAPPTAQYGPPPPSTTTNKPHRERKISAASINSFLSRITSRDKDKDKDKDPPRAASSQDTDRKVAPHMLLNHVGKPPKGQRGNIFGRMARKLSLIRRRSVDVIGAEVDREVASRPSFEVQRPGRQPQSAPTLQRRATLDLTPSRAPTYRGQSHAQSQPQSQLGGDLFAPIDPQLRSSRLINAPLSPPPRIPDLAIPGDRGSWASLRRHVSNAKPPQDDPPDENKPPPIVTSDERLAPPPPIGGAGKHPDSPHSIPKWGITNGPDKGPGLIMNGSPTDDSPMSLPKPVLMIANPDMVDSEGESIKAKVKRKSIRDSRVPLPIREPVTVVRESVVEDKRNRALPAEPSVPVWEERKGRESVKPLVVRKDPSMSRSRTPSPVKPNVSGRESPVVVKSGRESPVVMKNGRDSPAVQKSGRESPTKRRPKRDHSPVKPVRRTEPLKDHSASGMGSPGMSLRTSAAMGSTTSVDAIQGDDDVEFGAKPKVDLNGRTMIRTRPSMDSISKMHVITPKTSLQKIRVRVVSNPPPVEIAKESSPVKESAPELVESPEPISPAPAEPRSPSAEPSRAARFKSRPRSGYTGKDSRYSMYGTAFSESTDDYGDIPSSPMGPRKRISTIDPGSSAITRPGKGSPDPHTHAHSKSASADLKITTPYMTPTDEHAPLHPFSDKPVEYHNLVPSMAPISVMHVETPDHWSKPGLYDSKPGTSDLKSKPGFKFADSKGAWMEDDSFEMAPPKAPFMNEEFSVSKEKLAAQGEFKKHSRESTAESERRRTRDEREAELRKERERAERAQQRERERQERERERQEHERLERERAEQERAERAEQERQERERLRQEARAERLREQERLERERVERERAELERIERERIEREQAEKERARAERERARAAAQRQRELELERERERERIKDQERLARERDRERVEMERLEHERQEMERERIERERTEARRAEWERMERERLEYERMERERIEFERMEEETRRREQPPPLLHSHTGGSSVRRPRHEVDGEREVHIVTTKDVRKSRRRTPNHSRSTSPTSTAPPPPPKDDRPAKVRQRSQTDVTYTVPITSAIPPPPAQQSVEIIGGVPVLPQGTHVEVMQPFHTRPTSENTIDAPLKAREAWERERLDKGQSVLGPGGQRAVIPDIGSPRPVPDPRQRIASASGIRSQTVPVMHAEPFILSPPPVHPSMSANVLPDYAKYSKSSNHAPLPSRSHNHNPLPKLPTIDGPYPLHRPYTNPNRQPGPSQTRSRNPLPEPPRVSSYPLHHNVSPTRGVPPGAVR